MRGRWISAWVSRVAAGFVLLAVAAAATAGEQSRLDRLYADLKASRSESQAQATERKIWIEWLKHDEPVIADMMTNALERIKNNELKLALAILNQVVEEDPKYAEGWNSRATVLFLLGAHDRSIGDIGRTLALEPRHFGAWQDIDLKR